MLKEPIETKHKGSIALFKFCTRAAEKGYIVSFPGTECRYDAILDDGNKLWRVQVKYTSKRESKVSYSVDLRRKTRSALSKTRTYSPDEVDCIVIYIAPLDELVWLPPKEFNDKTAVSIRFADSNNKPKNANLLMKLEW